MGTKRVLTKGKDTDLDLEEVFELFLEEKTALNKSTKTIRNYQGSFQVFYNYIENKEGFSTKTDSISERYVHAFSTHMLNKENRISPASINHYLREIRAFLYWAMEKDYLPNRFKIKLVTEHDTIPDTYTDKEMDRLLAKPEKNASFVEWRNWASISWMFATGNRAATVCNVKLCDLDFTRKEIVIRYTKTRTPQILPMSTALSYVLKDYMRKWRHGAGDKAYLFPNISDEKLTVGALEQSVRDYNHRHGVKTTSVHAFRHTFAKNWIINTGDVFRLQKMLGHKTLEMTRRYVNLFGEDLKIGFDSYNPLDRQKGTRNRRQEIKRAV